MNKKNTIEKRVDRNRDRQTDRQTVRRLKIDKQMNYHRKHILYDLHSGCHAGRQVREGQVRSDQIRSDQIRSDHQVN